ncbi:MAG: ATP synthase F1 subunit epsilon [Firmicutes bacterium]|nr:ATP synthase F1 subunit epsilon [Bacillota bacterium]
MDGHLLLEVVTPERKVFSAEVSELSFPTATRGYYGILPGHTPIMTPVGDGLITYVQQGQKHVLTVFGGFAEVGPDRVTILARESELPESLDATALEVTRQEALKRVKEAKDPHDLAQAQADLTAAELRLQALQGR